MIVHGVRASKIQELSIRMEFQDVHISLCLGIPSQ